MIYPKSPFCPLNDGNAKNRNTDNRNKEYDNENNNNQPLWSDDMQQQRQGRNNNLSKGELMNIINELEFAVTDLHLFLDTHPNEEEALKTFTMLASALKSYKHDFVQKHGPLYATDSSDETPFDWVSAENKWPWQL